MQLGYAAIAPSQPLAWILPFVTGAAVKKKKRKKRKKKKRKKKEMKVFKISYYIMAIHKSREKLYGFLSIFYNISSPACTCDSFLQSKVDHRIDIKLMKI